MVKLCRTRMQQFFCDMLNYQQIVSANIVNIFVFFVPYLLLFHFNYKCVTCLYYYETWLIFPDDAYASG